MSYLLPNNIFIERGELNGFELFRFGYFQGADPKLVNRSSLEEIINNIIHTFPSLDEYGSLHTPEWVGSN